MKAEQKAVAIDKDFIRTFRAEINAALAELAKKHGVVIKAGNATFDPGGSATYKLEVSAVSEDGHVRTPEWLRFENMAGMLGLNVEFLGKRIRPVNAKDEVNDWVPIGMNTTGTKVQVKRPAGMSYKGKTDGVFLLPTDMLKQFKLVA
jgi:hypothetical protein